MMQSPMTAGAAKCRLTRYIMLLLSRDGQCVCRPIRHRKVPARAATAHVRNTMLRCDVGGDLSRYCCNVDWVRADAALTMLESGKDTAGLPALTNRDRSKDERWQPQNARVVRPHTPC